MNEWISIKNKLPKKPGYYLCFRLNSKMPICIREFDEWISNSRKRFWINGGEDLKITHWMPLPNPPKDSSI